MTSLQRLILFFIPARHRAAAEAESRAWQVACGGCGHTRSIWDLGGIRWKAAGNPTTRLTCPACRIRGLHRIEKTAAS